MAEPQKKDLNDFLGEPVTPGGTPADQSALMQFLGEPVHDRPSTSAEKGRALGQGVLGGAVEGGGLVGGAVLGGQLGALAGPGAPIAVPTGIVLGGLAGWYAGYKARQGLSSLKSPISEGNLTFEKVEDLPPDQRPYGIAGEVMGSGASATAGVVGVAKAGVRAAPTLTGNFFNRILDTAANRTGTFLAVEGSSLVGSAVGGGLAEEIVPGSLPARLTGEVVGGFFNFPRMAVGATRFARDRVVKTLAALSPAAAQTRAGRIMLDIIEEAGEDPQQIVGLLKAQDLPGVYTTSAQKTGSPALGALEKDMIEQSREFGNIAHKQAQESMEALGRLVDLLRGTGDPNALRAAAEIRAASFRTVLQSRVDRAMDEAVEAATKITDDTPETMSELSRTSRNILDTALKQSRTAETELWDNVARDVLVPPTNLLARHAELRGGMLPRETMPDVIEGTIFDFQEAGTLLAKVEAGTFPPQGMKGKALEEAKSRIAAAEDMFTSGFLIKLRKRALAMARAAGDRPGGGDEARIYSQIADATLADLNAGFKNLGEVDEAYDVARTFSRELNDVFTRTFAGAAQRTGQGGADRLSPELLLRRAMAGGKEAAALRLSELEEATRFLPSRDLGGPEAAQNVELMLDAQQRLLRLTAANTVDPLTGRVNARALQKFINDNGELMNRFPEVRRDLQRAVDTGEGLKAVERLTTNASAVVQKKAAFAKIIGVESPADAIQGIVQRSTNPAHQLAEFARFARNAGEDAREGFKASVWEYAMQRAERMGGNYVHNLLTTLQQPMRPGLPSILGVLQKEGTLTGADSQSLREIVKRFQTIADAMSAPGSGELVAGEADAFSDFVMRVIGAQAGTKALEIARKITGGAATAGPSIIVAGRGSAFIRAMLERIPNAKTKEALSQLLSDPQLAAKVLERPASQAAQIQQARQLHAYLVSAGLTAPLDDTEESELNRRGRTFQEVEEAPAPATPGDGAVLEGDDATYFGPLDAALFQVPDASTDDRATRAHIQHEEGMRLKRYKDPAGNYAIGVGFNLERADADDLLKAVGADPEKIKKGKASLTEEQANQLFEKTYSIALSDVRQAVPNIDAASPGRQTALIDVAFNLGETRFRGFTKMLAAARKEDWDQAAKELLNSDYAKQLPKRAKRNAELLKGE